MSTEKRLIDANAFFAEIERRFCVNCDYFDGKCEECLCLKVGDMLANTPTVDAVEVCRCKDCNEYDEETGKCYWWLHKMESDDFCSYGERREGE